jgi:lysozyme family protein
MSLFDQCLAVVVDSEGGFSRDARDPGNWTGGRCGAGALNGTKFGISAAAYPDEAIEALTFAQAGALYRRDFWDRVAGDQLPPPLALLVFDAAVNNGVARAACWLQAALGVAQDGAIGPGTLAALHARAGEGAALCAEYLALRLAFMAGLPTWRAFGAGWARRLCRLPYQSLALTA